MITRITLVRNVFREDGGKARLYDIYERIGDRWMLIDVKYFEL